LRGRKLRPELQLMRLAS